MQLLVASAIVVMLMVAPSMASAAVWGSHQERGTNRQVARYQPTVGSSRSSSRGSAGQAARRTSRGIARAA